MTEFVKQFSVETHSEQETLDFAKGFAETLPRGAVVALYGTLGAGKTVISRGICAGLGFKGQVNSPTYTIVHEYPNKKMPLFHLDLYRLPPHADLEEIGIDYYMSQEGVTLIEWPERLDDTALVSHRIDIEVLDGDARKITVSIFR
jgi:tRNA threonylcarbamoyladenosine biosynthesis protein TsaE